MKDRFQLLNIFVSSIRLRIKSMCENYYNFLEMIMPKTIFPLKYQPSYLHMVFYINPYAFKHLNKIEQLKEKQTLGGNYTYMFF